MTKDEYWTAHVKKNPALSNPKATVSESKHTPCTHHHHACPCREAEFERTKQQRDELLNALEMVRDADEDAKQDGLPTMPPCARATIDTAIAKAGGEA